MPTVTADAVLLTTDDYHRLIEAGILTEDDRVELIDGRNTPMDAVGGAHVYTVNRLTRLFATAVPADVEVSVQNPAEIGLHQEPEPDLTLFRRLDAPRVPKAEEVLLVVEVADTTLRQDREVKLPRYAAAAVPEVWIVDLEHHRLEIYTEPSAGTYAEKRTLLPDDAVVLPRTQTTIRVGDVLP